jgi:hypothetical protein
VRVESIPWCSQRPTCYFTQVVQKCLSHRVLRPCCRTLNHISLLPLLHNYSLHRRHLHLQYQLLIHHHRCHRPLPHLLLILLFWLLLWFWSRLTKCKGKQGIDQCFQSSLEQPMEVKMGHRKWLLRLDQRWLSWIEYQLWLMILLIGSCLRWEWGLHTSQGLLMSMMYYTECTCILLGSMRVYTRVSYMLKAHLEGIE